MWHFFVFEKLNKKLDNLIKKNNTSIYKKPSFIKDNNKSYLLMFFL